MKLVLFGAAGYIGLTLIIEALKRNHQIVAIAPFPEKIPLKNPDLTIIQTDVSTVDKISEVCQGADAVIVSHSSFWENPDLFESVLEFYPFILEGAKEARVPRILFVGEAGTLFVEPGIRLMDTGAMAGLETSGLRMLGAFYQDILKHEHDIDWVYFSPAANFIPAGRTEEFRLGKDDLIVDPHGQSAISVEDYASATLDELDAPIHHQERFTIGY